MSVVAQVRRLAAVEAAPSLTIPRVLAVIVFAAATALGARIGVPIPGTVVPVTLQTLVVVLSGMMLGPWLGAAAQLTYLAAGLMGAPVFAQGWSVAALVGPTGGYLVAFPAAAWLAGRIAGRARAGATSLLRLALAAVVGGAFILVSGAAWLSLSVGGVVPAFAAGIAPFLLGDALKTALALLLARAFRRRILALL